MASAQSKNLPNTVAQGVDNTVPATLILQQRTSYKIRTRILLSGALLLVLLGTLMPGALKAWIESRLGSWLPWSSLGHFFLFAALALFQTLRTGHRGTSAVVGVGFAIAVATETLQNWIPGRHPLASDVLLDVAGTIFGWLIANAWLRQRSGRTLANT
jgi:hypothetical protein